MKCFWILLVGCFSLNGMLKAQEVSSFYATPKGADLDSIDLFLGRIYDNLQTDDANTDEDLSDEEMDNLDTTHASILYTEDMPGYGLYKSWDTSRVHYPKTDFTNMPDSVVIHLVAEGPYVHPCNGIVTSKFGWRKRRYHYGYDVNLNTGDPLKCAFEGVVRFARYCGGYGNVVLDLLRSLVRQSLGQRAT